MRGQTSDSTPPAPLAVFVGGETENYLRILQTLGVVPLYPWSVRGFSPAELRRLAPRHDQHPQVTRPEFRPSGRRRAFQWEVLPLEAAFRYNSAYPYGSNDGAIWAGRGLTSTVQLGGAVRWGPLSLVVAPIAFRAENASFELSPNGQVPALRFGDPQWSALVDRPQRFGDGPYRRIDPGQTTLRFDWLGVAIGGSTANQWIGPMIEYPYLLGDNAGGFPHVFVGTSRPLDIWIGRVHGRVFYGELSQSDYTSISPAQARRFASGFTAVLMPGWLPGLELGLARFIHAFWPEGGVTSAHLRMPFGGISLPPDPNSPAHPLVTDATNQLGSAFVRWVLPKSGFELYGEFGREDHAWDTRDMLLEIDHVSSLGIGFRKAWLRSANEILSIRGEVMDYRTPVLWRHRGEGATYYHPILRQGHTHRGQLLGADLGVGSSQGLTLEMDRRTPAGGLRATWSSVVRRDGSAPGMIPDVQHLVGVEKLFFRGPFELAIGVGGAYEFNRDFVRDATNYNGTLRFRWTPERLRSQGQGPQ